ncbi:MAG: hypothetical protein IT331_01825 [Anaerolineae bacterium]|nr:hypothetical protein [Anaerolineae bacterium]
MNLSELVVPIIILAIWLVGIAALVLLLDVLFPRLVRRASSTTRKMPVRSALVGLVNLVFFAIVSVAALSLAEEAGGDGVGALLRLFALFVLLILNAFLAMGLTAVARWLGERILPDASAPRQVITGIGVLELASLAPLIGWVIVPLVALLTGYGAVIIALVWRRE